MWIFETKKYTSEKNGEIICRRVLGRWGVYVRGIDQTSPYITSLWQGALKRIPRGITIDRVLLLGIAAGGWIDVVRKRYPGCHITAVEHDPVMMNIARELALIDTNTVEFVVGDAGKALKELEQPYDLILIDLFTGPDPSPLLSNAEFLEHLQGALSTYGCCIANVFRDTHYLASMQKYFTCWKEWQIRSNHLGMFRHIVPEKKTGQALKKSWCESCGLRKTYHIQTWIEGLCGRLPSLPQFPLSYDMDQAVAAGIEMIFRGIGLVKKEYNFSSADLMPRNRVFAQALRSRNIPVYVLRGPLGYTDHFGVQIGTHVHRFDGLPVHMFGHNPHILKMDDKMYLKKVLRQNSWPFAEGKSFWFWQKRKAHTYAHTLGFPLVVKPENGSVARHVSTALASHEALARALASAYRYAPAAIIEKHIEGPVYRLTVVAHKHLFCSKQLPAHVTGDGVHSIEELISIKNADPSRGPADDARYLFHHLIAGDETPTVLAEQEASYASIPPSGKRVYIRRDPFMKFGGDLEELTGLVHPDNALLAYDLARTFNMFLVGIDFLIPDITKSWKEQSCAILELNSLPYIDMHHFPTYGTPQNVAGVLLEEALG